MAQDQGVKFLLDHDVPDALSYLLRELGHDVLLLREVIPTDSRSGTQFCGSAPGDSRVRFAANAPLTRPPCSLRRWHLSERRHQRFDSGRVLTAPLEMVSESHSRRTTTIQGSPNSVRTPRTTSRRALRRLGCSHLHRAAHTSCSPVRFRRYDSNFRHRKRRTCNTALPRPTRSHSWH